MLTHSTPLFLLALLLALVQTCAARAEEAGRKRPNVVFLLTDDQRPDSIAALGNKQVRTPNIDKLVERGFVFHNTYCMGANTAAVCLPSRTMILSGLCLSRMPEPKGAKGGKDAKDDDKKGPKNTFPLVMKENGYVTLRSGKNSNVPNHITKQFDKNIMLKRSVGCTKEHTDNGIEFIRDNAGKKPFFLYLAYATPHDPQPAPQRFYDMYKPQDIQLSPRFLAAPPFDHGGTSVRDEFTIPWPRTPESVQARLARYYASITYTDEQIGRVLDALKESGQSDNTLLVFASDNGLSLGDHGLMGKQNLFENGGMHVPLIVCGPGIPKGQTDAFAYLYDIFPTVCEYCGIEPPGNLDGKSLLPVIRGKTEKVRDYMFNSYGPQRSVRDKRWKLIRYTNINRSQLFDLQNDPDELSDLAGKPDHEAKVKEMLNLMAKMQKQFGDKAALTTQPYDNEGALDDKKPAKEKE
ncbi:MAG: sulfatase-like hydrolase/transferase [Planctomycetota bacterium]|nr:sulfatase-like hydrolase/transferase [Planctomycetota bacterium]